MVYALSMILASEKRLQTSSRSACYTRKYGCNTIQRVPEGDGLSPGHHGLVAKKGREGVHHVTAKTRTAQSYGADNEHLRRYWASSTAAVLGMCLQTHILVSLDLKKISYCTPTYWRMFVVQNSAVHAPALRTQDGSGSYATQ